MAPSKEKDELISMEEGRSNIIVNRLVREQSQLRQLESGQPSNKKIPWASLRNMLQSLEDAISVDEEEKGKRPKIQKASYMLRRDEKMVKYFAPRMVSIGPLHHGDKFVLGEKLKLKLAALFILKYDLDEVDLVNKLKGKIESLKKCYSDEDIKNFHDDDLAWMFFVDGSALIHYIDNASNEKLRNLTIKMDMEAFAQQDLFLLDNQLPFQVLDVLITSIANQDAKNAVQKSISTFVDKIARNIRSIELHHCPDSTSTSSSQPPPAHLLDRLWRHLGFHNKKEGSADASPGNTSTTSSQSPPAHLLELLWRRLVGDNTSQEPPSVSDYRYPFRNVNELKATWIEFKPADTKGSLRDVSFDSRSFNGTSTLPSLVVDDSTEPMFLNLIALEMCPDFENDFQISSYISFLGSLIDQPADVKDLRKAKILRNALGSDEEVARLFNEIGANIVSNPLIYLAVKDDIERHCTAKKWFQRKWNTWIAQAYRDYFSSPWTFLALAATTAALVMTYFQTWYTIFPRK